MLSLNKLAACGQTETSEIMDKKNIDLDVKKISHIENKDSIISLNKMLSPKPYQKVKVDLKSGSEIFSSLIKNKLINGKHTASERALDAMASSLTNVLNTATDDVDLNGNKVYVKNFLQCDQSKPVKVTPDQFSLVHKAEIFSRLSVCFDGFMNSNQSELSVRLNTIREKLSKNEKLNESEEKHLFEKLTKDALKDTQGNNLYTNKLLKPENLVLEFPGDAAVVKNETEARNNKILVEKFGFPSSLLDRPSAKLHETYALNAFMSEKGEPVTLGQLFGGALQGIMRDPVDSSKSKSGLFNEGILASGGLHFDFKPNEKMYQNNIDTLGQDILDLAVNLNMDNFNRSNMEGFTAGVSGNALHYTIQTAKLCRATNATFNFEQVLDVCLDHLVGDSVKQPVHHSLPEVIQGAYIANMLINKGVLDKNDKIMKHDEMYSSLKNAISDADQKITDLMATTYHR